MTIPKPEAPKHKIISTRIDAKLSKKVNKKRGKISVSDYLRNLIEEDLKA